MMSPEDMAARLGLMTSSTVAACLGLSRKASPLQGWCWVQGIPYMPIAQEIAGQEVTQNATLTALQESNPYTQRGDDLEPIVLRYGARMLRCDMEHPGFVRHADGWSGDSVDALYVDRVTGEVACAEAKTVSAHASDDWGQEMSADIPRHYRVQCHWHLLHHPGVEVCYVPFLGGYDLGYRLYRVERDADYERELWERAHEFWRAYVQPNVRPPVSELDTEYLQRKWPRGEPEKVYEVTEQFDEAVRVAIKWRDRKDVAERSAAAALNVVRDLLGDAGMAAADDYKVSYRNNKDSEKIDWEALARHKGATEAEIHQFTHRKPGPRVLRVTGRGDLKKKKDPAK